MKISTKAERLRKLRTLKVLAQSAMIGEPKRAAYRARFSQIQQQKKAIDDAAAEKLRKRGISVLTS